MRKIIPIILLLCSTSSFAQKVEVKDHLITVDDKPYAKIVREGGAMAGGYYFDISGDSSGKKLMRISIIEIELPEKREPSNPKGTVLYMKFTFFDSARHICEVNDYYFKDEKMAKFLIKNGLIKDGALDEEEVLNFIAVNGTPFSDRNSIKIRL